VWKSVLRLVVAVCEGGDISSGNIAREHCTFVQQKKYSTKCEIENNDENN
jgi:hypothetical protein